MLEHLDGSVVDDVISRDGAVPAAVLDTVPVVLAQLTAVPAKALPRLPRPWRNVRDTTGFAHTLIGHIRRVLDRHRRSARYRRLYQLLGVPDDPLKVLWQGALALRQRPLGLLHGDLNPRNLIIDRLGRLRVIDWEVAGWGDVLLDLARHLNRTRRRIGAGSRSRMIGYSLSQRADLLRRWCAAMPAAYTVGWEADLPFYEMVDQLQLALLNLPRHAKAFRVARTPVAAEAAIDALTEELALAFPHWGLEPPTRDAVAAALHEWAGSPTARPDRNTQRGTHR